MGFGGTLIALAASLKLNDEFSQPLDTAVKGAKKQFDELSVTGQRLEKMKAFAGVERELADLSKAFEEAKRKRDFFMQSAEVGGDAGAKMFSQDIRAAKQEVAELERAVAAKAAVMRDMGASMREAGMDATGLGGQIDALEQQLQRESGIQAMRDRLNEFGRSAVDAGKNIESVGIRLGAIGAAGNTALSGAGLDLKTLAGEAIRAESALYGVAATADLSGDAARRAVAAWQSEVNRIAGSTNQTQAEVIAALGDLVAKGTDPDAALGMLEAIGRAATASGAQIKDMASAANAAYQNMGVGAGQSLEIMAQAGKAGAFELRDMAQYFDLLTVKSKLLGAEGAAGMASLAAAAQIARKGAGDTSTAANNLANFLDKLTAPVTIRNFKKLGVDLSAEVKAGMDSGDLIGYMGALVQKLTQGDAAKLSQLFNDVQAKNFIAPLLQNLDEYKRIRDEALSAGGVVDTDFNTAMQAAEAQLKSFQITSAVAVGDSSALTDIVGALKSISAWAAENPELAKWLIFGSAGLMVGGAVVASIGAVVTAIGTIVPAMGAVAAFLVANPVVATVLGVGAAATAGWAAGGYIADWLDTQIQALTGEQGATLGTKLYDLIEGPQGIVPMLASVPDRLAAVGAGMRAAGADLMQQMRAGIASGLQGALGIGEKLAAGVAYIKSTAKDWLAVGRAIIDGLIEGIKQKAKEVVDKVRGLGTAVVREMKDLLGIKSPSKVFEGIGENIAAGLAKGIADNKSGVESIAESLADSVTRAFDGMEKGLTDFVTTGKGDFSSFADSIIRDMARIAVQQAVTKPLERFIGGFDWGGLFGFSQGGAPGGTSAYRNQVVDQPTLFAFAKGGVMGEAGPEAIMPLRRGPDGSLGVAAHGAGGQVTVNVYNNASGTKTETRERTDGGGNRMIDVFIEQVKGAIAGDITRGSGAVPDALVDTYGLNRVAGAY